MSTLPQIPSGSTIRQNADGSWSYRDGPHAWRPMPAPLTAAPWVVLEPAAPAPTTGTAMSAPKGRTDAAQAVYEAAHNAWATKDDPERIAAATIRALVTNHGTKTMGGIILNGDALLAIATELEGANG